MFKNLTLAILVAFAFTTSAQQLVTPSFTVSSKKTSFITLKDGKKIEGNMKSLDRNKGLIEEVKIKDFAGKKHKIDAEDIDFMYLPISGLEKLNQKMDFATDMQQWDDPAIESDLLKDGYAYYENATVKLKKKTERLMMQLLNPTFSKNVKIYHDPRAKETTSWGVGGIKMAGGDAKSYYVMKGDDPAYLVKKKEYDEEFVALWGDCGKDFIKLYEDAEVSWYDLALHAVDYSKCMEK